MDWELWIGIPISLCALCISVFTARLQYREKRNEVLCEQAIQCLSRAYGFLFPNGAQQPDASRLAWLQAGRQLRIFEQLSDELKKTWWGEKIFCLESSGFIAACEAAEDDFRHRLYRDIPDTFFIFAKITNIPPWQAESSHGNELEPHSVALVLSYCQMHPDRPDPLDTGELNRELIEKIHPKFKSRAGCLRDSFLYALRKKSEQ